MVNANSMEFIKYLEALCVLMLCPPTSCPLCIYCGFWFYVTMEFLCIPIYIFLNFFFDSLSSVCLFCLSLVCFYSILILDAGLYSNEREK